MIANPTPITAATFAGMWISHLGVFLPTEAKPKGFLVGNFRPYDGTHLLATGSKSLHLTDLVAKLQTDAELSALIDSLIAECKRQAGKQTDIAFITVNAPDPSRPVMCQIIFTDKTHHPIMDCFALAATDPVFSGVLFSVMGEMAKQAGFAVV